MLPLLRYSIYSGANYYRTLVRNTIALAYLLPALIWHGAGIACFVNWNDVWHNPPIHYTDYAVHYADVVAVGHFLSTGHLWGYDPFFQAGFPNGTLFDVDNKAIELVSWLLQCTGIPLDRAFNVVILTLIAIAPFTIYLAARTIGLAASTAGLAQIMALTFWYGDPVVRWMWQGGTVAFAAASAGSLAVAAGFWQWATWSERRRSGALLWFGVGPLLFWIHPWAFFTLGMLLSVGTLVAWRWWTWRMRIVPLLWTGWVLLVNWPWLSLVFRFLFSKTRSNQFLQGGMAELFKDALSLSMLLRLAVLGMAACGLWRWRQAQNTWWLPVAASVIALILLAYTGVYLRAGDIQPYRFLMPALLLATLPAADLVRRVWVRSPRNALIWLLVIGAVGAVPLDRARPRELRQPDGTPTDYLSGPQPAEQAVCGDLRDLDLQSGRVLVNDWRLGAFLPACSGAQIIGGQFLWVWTTYGYTNAGLDDVLGRPVRQLDRDELAAILLRYNVRWMVINTGLPTSMYTFKDWQRDHPGLLTPRAAHGVFTIYAVQQPASWFIAGDGAVAATYNRLEVRNVSAGGLVLKYHWVDTLRTEQLLRT